MAKFKLTENWGSTILGFIVVIIMGGFLLNVFRGDTNQQGELGDASDSTDTTQTPKTYIVKADETLWIISENMYGSGFNWISIAEANNITNPDDIEEGQELIIPDVEPILPPGASLVGAAAGTAVLINESRENQTENIDTTSKRPTDVTVQPGDTLIRIATLVYGSPDRWIDIARANNITNADQIEQGMVLIIPE